MPERRSKAEGMEKEERVDPLKVQKLKVRLESPLHCRDVLEAGAGETRKKPRQTTQMKHQTKPSGKRQEADKNRRQKL